MTIIEVNNMTRAYGEVEVLKGLDFTIEEGEFVVVMGKSGCGKTTLLKILGLVDDPTSGKYLFKGVNVNTLWGDKLASARRNDVGFVFQDYYLMGSLSVRENIMLPMLFAKERLDKVMEAVEAQVEYFEIKEFLDKLPGELSGGQRQRVAICRALVNGPDLILADEPTGNLDSKSGQAVIDALCKINEEQKKTVVMVTHDPKMASYGRRVMFMKDGVILDEIKKNGDREAFYRIIVDKMEEL